MERTDILAEEQDRAAAELKSLQDKARAEELARVRAEAALEESRRFQSQAAQAQPQQQAAWTDDQWEAEAQKIGTTGALLKANAIMADTVAQHRLKPLEEKVKAAEERARKAEERAQSWESRQGREGSIADFIKKNPAYGAYEKEIREFTSNFSEADMNDLEKRSKIFDHTSIYVKGLAGGKVKQNTAGSGSSARLGGGNDFDAVAEDENRIDFTGLDEKGQRRTIEDVHADVLSRMSDAEQKKFYEASLDSSKLGVRYNSESEWKERESAFRASGFAGGRKG